jgi:hypothetical protein
MSDEREVNPTQESEKVGVSSNATTAGEVATPDAVKGPARRGRGISRDLLSPEELKAHKKEISDKHERKKKATGFVYSSSDTPTKPAAKELLVARGLRNPHIIDLCYDLALIAAEQNHLPAANRFLFQNGIRKLLESYQSKAPKTLDLIPAEEVAGELLNRAELYALYDFGFWRQPDVAFDQWLADRLKFKSSAFELSKILGKEDFGKVHEEWTSFAPRWNPVGLKPNYTLREALTWLDAQADRKKYLLVASRNSMKSTWARIFALTLTLTLPDAPILIISETNKLSKKAMREFRGYLEMNPSSPTLFQQYFSEYTIAPDAGQSSAYENPLAHLGLPQIACESSSMESANTGSRFWLALFDDPISRDNGTSNEDQRAEAISKHGSIMKLRDPAGYALNIQTPWVQDDLGDVMIQQNDKDEEHPLAVRIDPVFEIRPEARGKGLLELKEEDVILNFLPKLNWRFVRDEIRSPEGTTFFRTQYLCEWVRDDDQIKVNFDHEALWGRVRAGSYFGNPLIHTTFISLDRNGGSNARYADFACANVNRIQAVENKNAMVVLDTYMERVRDSELILGLVKLIEKWKPTLLIAQQDKGYLDFGDSLRKALMMRGMSVPYLRFIPINNAVKAKARRVKSLELPLSDGRLWFSSNNVKLEEGLNQMEKFDGITKSNSHRKDDWCDSCALGWEALGPRHQEEIKPEEEEERSRREDEEAARARRQHLYDAMFGNPVDRSTRASQFGKQPKPVEPEPDKPVDPRMKIFGNKGPWRL